MNSVSHDAGSMAVVDQGESSASSNTSSLLFIPASRVSKYSRSSRASRSSKASRDSRTGSRHKPSQSSRVEPTFHGKTRSDEVRRVGALRTNHLGGVMRERSVEAHVLAVVEQLRMTSVRVPGPRWLLTQTHRVPHPVLAVVTLRGVPGWDRLGRQIKHNLFISPSANAPGSLRTRTRSRPREA
jgi:hypothetical protein